MAFIIYSDGATNYVARLINSMETIPRCLYTINEVSLSNSLDLTLLARCLKYVISPRAPFL